MHKTYIVEGMTCAACSSAVERVFNRSEHVIKASVNLTTKKLDLEYDDSKLSQESILEMIEKIGYSGSEYLETKEIVMPIDGMT